MFQKIRDVWITFAAVGRLSADFFRRWFLPLHSDDDDDDEEESRFLGWSWDDVEDDEDSPPELKSKSTPPLLSDNASDQDDL